MLKQIIVWMEDIETEEMQTFKSQLKEAGIALEFRKTATKEQQEETIYITDNSDIFKQLNQENAYVIAYFRETNKGQDFSKAKYAIESLEEIPVTYFGDIYKRFRGEPWEILTTKRCIIREMTVEDVDAFYEIYKEPSITAYMDDLYENPEQERAYTREYIEKVYGFYGYGLWSVIKKDTGEIIGRAGLSVRPEFEDAELGFVIGVPWQRQGYGQEVCEAILRYAVENLQMNRIQALLIKGNSASEKLCQKLGFFYEKDVFVQNQAYQKYLYTE